MKLILLFDNAIYRHFQEKYSLFLTYLQYHIIQYHTCTKTKRFMSYLRVRLFTATGYSSVHVQKPLLYRKHDHQGLSDGGHISYMPQLVATEVLDNTQDQTRIFNWKITTTKAIGNNILNQTNISMFEMIQFWKIM